jgi:arylsulfatase
MSESRPNVLLVSIDSLRADHCGYLGDDRGLTPTLDALADDGVAFQNAVAPGPQTFSSMPAAFTGEYRQPSTNPDGDGEWDRRLGAIDRHVSRNETLPERLRRHGYSTAAFSPNPWTSTASGFDRGFDRFVDVSGNGSATDNGGRLSKLARRVVGDDPDSRTLQIALNMLGGSEFFAGWESFYDDLRATVDDLEEPYFLWVFLLDTHFPFVTSRRHREELGAFETYLGTLQSHKAMRGQTDSLSPGAQRRAKTCYRDTVRAADAFLDVVTTDLAADDPVTIVHSDHGESFGDHGNYGHHHRHVYEENVHVPYVVHGADVTADVDEPATLASLPDVLDQVARTGTFDPAVATEEVAVARSECAHHRAARTSRFKFVDCGGDTALYDLHADPDETADVTDDHPAVADQLADELDAHDGHVTERERIDRATRRLARTGRF